MIYGAVAQNGRAPAEVHGGDGGYVERRENPEDVGANTPTRISFPARWK